MSNSFQQTQLVLWETLANWKNNLKLARNLDQSYSKQFGKTIGSSRKPGGTINVPKPQRWTVSVGQAASFQGITNLVTPLSLSIQANVAYLTSSVEEYLDVDHMMKNYGRPAALALSNYVDYSVFNFCVTTCPNIAGIPGTVNSTNDYILQAGVNMDNFNAPTDVDDRIVIVSPAQMKKAITVDQGLFNAQQELAKQYRKATVGEAHGFQWFKSQNVPVLTSGTYAGTPLVNGASQTGSSLITDGWTSGGLSLKIGDRFTIANVFTVNAQSRNSIGSLQPFEITAATTDTTGAATLPIYPAITPTGDYQNVSSAPADNAAITMLQPSNTQYTAGLAFHEQSFAVVYGALDTPGKGVVDSFTDTDPETGCSMRYIAYYDGDNDNMKVRWDILFGFGALYPEWACVLAASAAGG